MPTRDPAAPLNLLVYSSNARTREQVQLALGTRIHPELPELRYTDVATGPMVISLMDAGGFDLVILDGNPLTAEPDKIKDIKVVETIKRGETIYARG